MGSQGQLAAMELKSYKGLPMNSDGGSGVNFQLPQSVGSNLQGFPSMQNSNSAMQNQIGNPGASQTIYSTQYQLILQNL